MPFSCLLIGNDTLTLQCGDKLRGAGHAIRAVVTSSPAVAEWAGGHGLTVVAPGKGLAERLGGTRADWLLSIANLTIMPDDVLALATRGAVNFHDGPLPRHAGLNAPVWALIEGETRHGITWHMIEGGVDEGDILVSRGFDINDADTALTLNTKAFAAALDSFDDLMAQLDGPAPQRIPQDLSQRSYHGLADRPAAGGLLEFSRPAVELERLIRALDHGPYWNPLCLPKLMAGGKLWFVAEARVTESHAAPGTVIDIDGSHLTVACGTGALVLGGLRGADGTPADPRQIAKAGDLLTPPDMAAAEETMQGIAASDAVWRKALAGMAAATLPQAGAASGSFASLPLTVPDGCDARVAAWASRLVGGDTVSLAFASADLVELAGGGFVSRWVPLTVATSGTMDDLAAAMGTALNRAERNKGFAIDLPLRDPALSVTQPQIGLSHGAGPIPGTLMTVEISDGTATLHHDTGAIGAVEASHYAARLELLAGASADNVAALPNLPDSEREMVLNRWNATETDHDRSLTMHAAFEAQAAKTPDAAALIFEGQSLTYADLNARANRAAHVLRGMGVGPDVVVGLCTRRSVDLMVGALAILKAGGAYLPLDPAFPADRLRHYIADSGTTVIVTQSALREQLPETTAQILTLDADPRIAQAPATTPEALSGPADLAYLIYTSGSTGTPKGVMVEHRNVANFYTGMDAHVPHADGGTWLAVTSLSFDISVLELFWTTARGFTVVLTSDEDRGLISNGPMPMSDQAMQFSLYYWGNDDGVGPDKYKTLLEGAKFADAHGFVAVWTPERHFHAFGGPYPNPSVTGAAVAGMTKNIGVRAGSCVAPLHHPARIAEEWAVIDNLTNGRAGLAIASGWQPDDFVLRPENTPPQNKPAMIESIETLRKLWRGEAVGFARKNGTMHEVVTQPRPVSKELPVWVTTAGNPETWKEAGRLGANVLTHLLGQSIDEVAGKIGIYHQALRDAGFDPADFTVTLMLHTCLAETRDKAREIAREPMKDYLRSAAGLIKQYAWAFPAFKKPEGVKNAFELDLGSLEADELEGILDFAFERYFNDSGMFGTIEDALARVEELKRIGVGEVACLIDYGIAPDLVLEGLTPLAQVVARANDAPELAADDFSIAAQIVRHGVTHMQCTPSMARMIAMNDEARFALRGVQHLLLGGEPLPGALVAEFNGITGATITNMYGPTETTIWSSVEPAEVTEGVVNIGLPIANTQLYVLDADRNAVPIGQDGELWIGGEGVTRGYWNRAELTAERYAENPFHGGRMYRTGDLVRRRADGRIDFIGRVDHQIKLRGFRIELGEIEAAIEAQADITQAVVVAREDTPGDLRLVGYYTGAALSDADLKKVLSARLPDYMVPRHFEQLESFPLTPNKKVDRNALPAPQPAPQRAEPVVRAPVTQLSSTRPDAETEAQIARIWTEVLGVQGITGRDSFFDLGGHSLLAVQAHRAIRDRLGVRALSITDVFRFPVLSDLAARVAELGTPKQAAPDAAPAAAPANDRADARASAMERRRAMRAKRRA
ncbi:MupA/Atu3671 family FMN-dependent luciferase-like monooxygenase [Aestuariicoccus sp. MJ-SS9]|uniref:MupA/Atu3671 family FMN-dependent luciferase-like monooxygenase n=1 Tax=Aestuariicoccus sp. MJ-SS9 TaxID=3079855 RepID=UPI00290842DE|nr:MupA/Atu3671 family FMN-dependent luciferase-like monooxygenase [Aestuariicoccus sp. MJ-SS9]MDU8910812.1 LLM class flavin-dependent oxidoreductase [Aestuariicoccus sp. MJ-SS9]